ncbi:MFS transporter [Rhizobium sp. CFBP 8762]|uniref:MFS transporter n=1 Tax=Rhizobium sp. CFBP 8762 TaxID=2775279 RepID=UPI001781C38E|nr:MFS transporter [Rhizobium sp. CFBP 8762]MBD8556197.1 MFS transporter [Rhizobium sp. CFBP 8762]
MKTNLLSVFALLLGTLFVFLGNGLHGLLLPVRGAAEGYSSTTLGLLGTSWASGFVLGCLLAPNIVKRTGHVRAFSGFAALLAIVALLTGIMVDPIWWIALRAITGFSTAGTCMIIESWLNERATNESRGMIFSLYIAITLFGVVGGQMILPLGDTSTPILFMVIGIVYCLAMLPTTLSTAASPQPLNTVRLDLPSLLRTSPVACISIVFVGVANGAFGTLGPVFGREAGLADSTIAIMMSVTIFAGAIMQLPAGRLSDRIDRRYVVAGLAAIGGVAGLLMFAVQPANVTWLLILIAVYGATANAIYPVAVAHANDFTSSEDFVKVAGGLLLLYGIGTIIGPTISGPVMSNFGPYALFGVTATAHLLIAGYAVFRSRRRAALPVEERDAYTATVTSGTMITPESLQLSPNAAPFPDEEAVAAEEPLAQAW